MQCPGCGFENPEGLKFCNECGTSLKRRCTQCGFENAPPAKFCGECGTALGAEGKSARAKSRTRKGAQTPGRAPRPAARPTPVRPQAAAPEAERRQLTVMFCDVVGSTPLSQQLDPEELRTVILAYQETCAQVIQRFEGHLARYIGDGLLVYFSYPQAHEDDAQRAVQAGLEIVAALPQLNTQLQQTVRVLQHLPLQVRVGIHTGLVVVSDMGGGGYRDPMAIVGETPNIAARLQEKAKPNSVVISPSTYRLVTGLFECQDLGSQTLKGISTALTVYQVVRESGVQSRFEAAVRKGLTPLVGREEELGLLRRRWEQAKAGEGQVVLLNGEPGIGKSRLGQELKEQVAKEDATCLAFRCSPYHQHSAYYPIIEHVQRLLQFHREETPQAKLAKLQQALAAYRFPQADTLPLLAALLSLPHPKSIPPLTLSSQKQKQRTQEALVAWIVEEAEKAAVYCVWEDLHWADPSTLEVLTLFLDQVPTTRLLVLLTFRPEFTPPWGNRSHFSQLTLSRLGRPQVEAMVERVTGGKSLPPEVLRQIVAKTDGVPLFVEELTKMVLESGLVRESDGHYELSDLLPPLAIPTTLQDSLMARLDRLATVKEVAQLGATLGREFAYEVLQAVAPVDEAALQLALAKLVEAEILYQRGLPPQARYVFKHALMQDTAYQSLLKSTRQQYHQQIAQVLEERFTETKETQPELLAHHYTEAGLTAQALRYWRKAGQRAVERSAHVEAIAHLTKGLELLKTLPETPERGQHELRLQIALSTPLVATKGYIAPEVERACRCARELCQQIGETLQLFPVLGMLHSLYFNRGELPTAHELAAQLLRLAQSAGEPRLLLWAHYALGFTLVEQGELIAARVHLEQSIALYDPQQHRLLDFVQDPRVTGLALLAHVLLSLGYLDQALQRSEEALALSRKLSHPFSLAWVLGSVAGIHRRRREPQVAQALAEELIALASEQGFALFLAQEAFRRGWDMVEQDQGEGLAQMRQGLTALRVMRTEQGGLVNLALLACAYGKVGQPEEGLNVLAEALAMMNKTGAFVYTADLYRLKGELLLQQSKVQSLRSKRKLRSVFIKPSPLPASSRRSRWSCEQ